MLSISRFLMALAISVCFIFSLFHVPSDVYGHDMYGSYSQWHLNENSVEAELSINPFLVAELGHIDEITDGALANERLQKAVPLYIQPYIDKNLSIWLDGKKHPFIVEDIKLDSVGQVVIKCATEKTGQSIKRVKIDYRLFFEETDNYHRDFANIIYSTKKDDVIDFIFGPDSQTWEGNLGGRVSAWDNVAQFIVLGVEHILTGYDHILFLIALIVVGLSIKEVLGIITSFTIAHSITLFMAALGIISLNSRFVEVVIALSICFVALENIFRGKVKYRWMVAFGFGLIHGFGFASMLENFISEKESLIYSVLSFNIGVEIGQLFIFIIVLSALYMLSKRINYRKITVGISALVFVMGFAWFVERLFVVKILWF